MADYHRAEILDQRAMNPTTSKETGEKQKGVYRFQSLEIPFPCRFHHYRGGNENAPLVSNLVSARFLFPHYGRKTRNEHPGA